MSNTMKDTNVMCIIKGASFHINLIYDWKVISCMYARYRMLVTKLRMKCTLYLRYTILLIQYTVMYNHDLWQSTILASGVTS